LQLSPDHSKSKLYWNKTKAIRSKKDDASALLKSGKVTEALALYSEAAAVDPANDSVNSKIHFNIAVCHSKVSFDQIFTEFSSLTFVCSAVTAQTTSESTGSFEHCSETGS
jgi:hypothetical protein